jgi:hypothetical protein
MLPEIFTIFQMPPEIRISRSIKREDENEKKRERY